jgi:hypothetical protein
MEQHALGRLVEHGPHHLVAASRYRAGSLALARLAPEADIAERDWNVR